MSIRGRAIWIHNDSYTDATVSGSQIFNGDQIKIEFSFFAYGVEYRTIVRTAPQPGWIMGEWFKMRDATDKGTCQGRLLRCEDGSLAIYGTWKEEGKDYQLIIFLTS